MKSASGKALLRKRGQHIERSFAHLLDQRGLRQATLRGELNLTMRQLAAALAYDLSSLMRHLNPATARRSSGWRWPAPPRRAS